MLKIIIFEAKGEEAVHSMERKYKYITGIAVTRHS